MNQKHLVLLLLLTAFSAPAQQTSVDTFSVRTLGEAASRTGDLAKPLTIEVEVALTGPVQDLGPLVSYLRSNGFAVEGHLPGAPSTQAPGKPLTLVGRKTAVFSREDIDRYEVQIRALVPKGLGLNWRFAQTKVDS